MSDLRSYDDLVSKCCQVELSDVPDDYRFKKLNPDTRWFVCPECKAHWGYHRMKGTWKVDPYDYTNNPKVKAALGLE